MIDRELLKDMGFELGTGWEGEVWVYEGMFWVYFSNSDWTDADFLSSQEVNANTISRKDFFAKFIKAIEDETADQYTIRTFED